MTSNHFPRIAVVIPAYKVRSQIMSVIENIGDLVTHIYVIDDCCPDNSGAFVTSECKDSRVQVIRLPKNLGVGGAVMAGYQAGIQDGVDVMVKVDGDGQMDPRYITNFVEPILAGEADYTKGNRFFNLDSLEQMPKARLIGNATLSFMSKLSSGYWDLFDPTNGYTAIHSEVARHLPMRKISHRYFFESDMLFRLNTLRAVVLDIPMDAKYGDEVSNLKIGKVVGEFLVKHARNFVKRVFYNYYLRDLSIASLELPLGVAMLAFGFIFGGIEWMRSFQAHAPASAGTVMLAGLPVIVGLQFVLAFLAYDIASVPRRPLHRRRIRRGVIENSTGRDQ
ncbi:MULTISPECIES: glycosyltransferase family 2 protein [unclassified Cupriavidus]|jgi:glycosyltransferase involved in cell wall biosynthesis|uniref:glycosyltransferase family 2 protein n=1 Tax=unclassified Cupriavidus TaxID=2640874 RepID=UPI0008F29049|nr:MULTISPECIES: glycosyltransferase family 2 protein [unclassified Cupriavidus]SFO65709.1 Glycosyltransferase involved in cell wall bisynthesis [Cupriavidus sp. OV096]